jgi:thiamine biosynthesis lipoprotein
MGSRFDITVVAQDSITANVDIYTAISEITRIEKLISSWDENSQTSKINRNAGIEPVKVDPELFNLIARAIEISKLTDGAFDISYASIDKIWKFDGSMTEIPSEEEIEASVAKIGYRNILLDKQNSTVFLKLKGMKIGFGAIGKGYAADKAKDLLISKGVQSGIINASGDMNTWGKQPNGSDWKIAITNPMDKNKVFALLPITNGAVVTSGNYEKYVNFNGKRYSHIIDPRTGYPSIGIISVTVFAPKAELADALATSIFVMGKEAGLDRINQMPKIECIIIDLADACRRERFGADLEMGSRCRVDDQGFCVADIGEMRGELTGLDEPAPRRAPTFDAEAHHRARPVRQ